MSLPVGFVVLSLMLYYPVYRLILTVSVGRLQKKLGKALTEEQVQGQKSRSHFIAILLVPSFAYLYNLGLQS